MKSTSLLIASAITLAIAAPVLAETKAEIEKCYGVAKATKNDCQTATSSCAGTAKKDAQKDAWIAVPKGTCEKIVGASLQPAK